MEIAKSLNWNECNSLDIVLECRAMQLQFIASFQEERNDNNR